MQIKVKVGTVRDVMEAAGLRPYVVAHALSLSPGSITMKLKGTRPWFRDELVQLAATINEAGRLKVTLEDLVKLAGPGRVRIRGYVA